MAQLAPVFGVKFLNFVWEYFEWSESPEKL